MAPRVLLLNPPVHDFAAYDFWARPLGLLVLGGLLQRGGVQVELLDALDPRSPWLPPAARPRRHGPGRGRFFRTPLPTPASLETAAPRDRRFARYGLPPDALAAALGARPRPDAVLVTCGMTYWYPGVEEALGLVRERWPAVPTVLGGVYASLCAAHASRGTADRVSVGPAPRALPLMGELLGRELTADDEPPEHGLAAGADAAALQTSTGCNRRCPYCGVAVLSPSFHAHAPRRVAREARAIAALGIRDVALYDDALLADPGRAVEVLERLAPLGLRLHGAAGLACRGLSADVARAMRRAGLVTVRLGLESADPAAQARLGGKVTTGELARALAHLEQAGYRRAAIGVYVMVGLPDQPAAEVERSIERVLELGARPHLAEYSPVPRSPLFGRAREVSPWPLDSEPLFHNPTLLPCAGNGQDHRWLAGIKQRLRERLG